jgi:16S rRNA (guanine527-N7)-methyltransferase
MNELAQQVYNMLGIQLSPTQQRALDCYQQELLEWSSRMNLTAIQEPEMVRTKHFLDSLSCLLAIVTPWAV